MLARLALESELPEPQSADPVFDHLNRQAFTPATIRRILSEMPHGTFRRPRHTDELGVQVRWTRLARTPSEKQMQEYGEVLRALEHIQQYRGGKQAAHAIVAIYCFRWPWYQYAERRGLHYTTVARNCNWGIERMARFLGWTGPYHHTSRH